MKKLFTLFISLSFVYAINAQTNLVPNADFESGDGGWTNSGADSRTIVSPGHESNQAYQVVGALNKGVQYVTDGTTVLAAGNYELSFWAKGTVGELAKFKVKYTDGTTTTITGTEFKESDVWEFFKLTYSLTESKNIDKFILQCASDLSPEFQTFTADDLFFGESATGIEPVDPEFTDFPFTEDFESATYTIGADIAKKNDTDGELDFWLTTDPQVFDRFWRGNLTTEYLASVDADAYAGSKAMKLAITTLEGNNFRLRTVNIPEGDYTIKFKAKTDGAGLGTAKIGFSDDPLTWYTLTDTYTEYVGGNTVEVNPSNGTTRLIIFYTSDPGVTGSQSYNIWIDDITIEEGAPTSINALPTDKIVTFPNPVSNMLFINAEVAVKKVELYSLSGQKIKEVKQISQGINVSDLSKGIYIASITVEGKTIQKKFIKK